MLSHYWRPAPIDYFETSAKEARFSFSSTSSLRLFFLSKKCHGNLHITLELSLKPKYYGVMEIQPLKVRASPTDISDTQKSMTEISNIEASSRKYRDDVSTLRVCHGVAFSSAVLVVGKIVEI